MPHYRNLPSALARSLLTLLCLFGCASPPSTRPAPEQELSDVPMGLDIGSTNTIYPGTLDSENYFVSNVKLIVASSGRPKEGCSGVLISLKQVLTAAHCVCEIREATHADKVMADSRLNAAFPSSGKNNAAKTKIASWKKLILDNMHAVADTSHCLKQVDVAVINYVASTQRYIPSPYKGVTIRPHPRFLSLKDNENSVLFIEADLALIELNNVVTESFRPIQWPDVEVFKDQQVVITGYGPGETGYPTTQFGYRHFGNSQIEQVEHFASGSTRFTTAAQGQNGREFSRNYEGDSGGGVFTPKCHHRLERGPLPPKSPVPGDHPARPLDAAGPGSEKAGDRSACSASAPSRSAATSSGTGRAASRAGRSGATGGSGAVGPRPGPAELRSERPGAHHGPHREGAVHLGTAATTDGTRPCGFGALSARAENRPEITDRVPGYR